jgi:hypothetical protein
LDTFLHTLDDESTVSFLNPDAADADADAADADEDSIFGPVRMCAMCSGELDSDEDVEEPLAGLKLSTAVVLNASFFDAQPSIVLDAAALGGKRAAAQALQHAVDTCGEGATIELRGQFRFQAGSSRHGEQLCITGAAVRLLGAPASAPWRPMHGHFMPDVAAAMFPDDHWWNVLARNEREAAAALGFPAAGIHSAGNCVEIMAPVWLEGLNLRSGDVNIGRNGLDEAGGDCAWAAGLCVSLLEHERQLAPFVARKCWLTAYEGTAVVLDEGAKAALLACTVTNCAGCAAVCKDRASLRVRGCRIACNMEPIQAGHRQTDAQKAAVAAANVVRDNFTDDAVGDDLFKFTNVLLLA